MDELLKKFNGTLMEFGELWNMLSNESKKDVANEFFLLTRRKDGACRNLEIFNRQLFALYRCVPEMYLMVAKLHNQSRSKVKVFIHDINEI